MNGKKSPDMDPKNVVSQEGPALDSKPSNDAGAFPRFRILLIEDVEPLLTIMAKGLAKYGQTVFPANSGPEGLEILKSHPVDVVVCDMGMPGMDGWKVAEKVWSFCRGRGIPRIPFLLLTGWAAELPTSTGDLANVGVDRVLDKPVEIAALIRAVEEVVSSSAGTG